MTLSRTHRRAFTLIEVLIVIVIIGILSAAIIPRLQGIQARARDTARSADINQLNTAIFLYQADNNSLPVGPGYSINTNEYITSTGSEWNSTLKSQLSPYLNFMPQDPHSERAYVYGYIYNTPKSYYRIYADYEAKLSQKGLMAYRDMETMNTTALRDMSGNGHDGTPMGGIEIGKSGEGRGSTTYFDGINDAIQTINNIDLSTTDKITVSFWMKSLQNSLSVVMEHSNNFNSQNAFLIDHSEYGSPGSYQISDHNSSYNILYTNNVFNDGQRHNTTITIDRSLGIQQSSIFIDGNKIATTPNSIHYTNIVGNFASHILYIGARQSSSYFFNGSLDDIRIYNRILSDIEIKDLYNNY